MSRPSESEVRAHEGTAAVVGIMAAIIKGADISATMAIRIAGNSDAKLASDESIAKRAADLYNVVWNETG